MIQWEVLGTPFVDESRDWLNAIIKVSEAVAKGIDLDCERRQRFMDPFEDICDETQQVFILEGKFEDLSTQQYFSARALRLATS